MDPVAFNQYRDMSVPRVSVPDVVLLVPLRVQLSYAEARVCSCMHDCTAALDVQELIGAAPAAAAGAGERSHTAAPPPPAEQQVVCLNTKADFHTVNHTTAVPHCMRC